MYSQNLAVIALALVFAYLSTFAFLAKKSTHFFLGATAFLGFSHLKGFLSLYLIEAGFFVAEQEKNGFPNGSLFYYFLFAVLTLIIAWLITRRLKLPPEIKSQDLYDVVFFAFFVIELIQSAVVHFNWNSDQRFQFYGGMKLARLYLAVDLGFNGIYLAQMVRKTSLFWFWSAMHLMVGILKNSPLSPLVFVAEITLTVYLLRGQLKMKHLALCGLLVIIGLILKWISLGSDSSLLANRMVEECHVFWGSINLWNSGIGNSSLGNFFDHFFDLSIYKANLAYGLGEIMYALNPQLTANMIPAEVRFTGGFPAILIFKFGLPLAFVLVVPIIALYVGALAYIYESIFYLPVLVFLLEYKVFDLYRDFAMMGEYGQLNFKFVVWFLLVAGLLWSKKYWLRNSAIKGSQKARA